MKKLVKLVLLLMIVYPMIGLAVSSCTDESDCSIAGRPMINATFHTMIPVAANRDSMANDTVDLLTITALGTDSIILNNENNVFEISVPLRYTDIKTEFVFQHSPLVSQYDTITINHSNTPQFISMDCGYEMKQAIIDIKFTKHLIDSISIKDYNTNTNGRRNLEIFYR